MKKIILVCLAAIMSATTVLAAQQSLVTEKVLKIFHQAFPEIKHLSPVVFNQHNKEFVSSPDKQSCKIEYAFDGTIFNTTKYYPEHDPSSVARAILPEKFQDEKIFEMTGVYAAGNENVSKKAVKYLNKKYGNVANVKWAQLDDKYLATFINEETTTKLLFDAKGNLIYSIDDSSEKLLPYSIKRQVANKYENYKITTVAKINEDSRITWVIKLAGETNYAAVAVEDGEMHETENFQRAN